MAVQLKLLVIIVFLVVGNITWAQDNATKFNGNFPTKQVRELWQVCSFTFQQRQPEIQLPLRWEMCDCYVDVIRETMTPEESLNITPEQTRKLTLELIDQCNGKLNNKPPVMT
jgi:hypothetical protein